ncbi:unnamed protein product [Ectocarpus sp. CCAP 1310/34]|nr:unnamed protein product [Ectocarpus sp. CCAP 1310/34]
MLQQWWLQRAARKQRCGLLGAHFDRPPCSEINACCRTYLYALPRRKRTRSTKSVWQKRRPFWRRERPRLSTPDTIPTVIGHTLRGLNCCPFFVLGCQVLELRGDAFQHFGNAAVVQSIVDKLPDIAREIAAPLAKTDKMVFIAGDGGGAGSRLTQDVGNILAQLPETVQALTGGNFCRLRLR